LIGDLRREGLALTHVSDLLPGVTVGELVAHANDLLATPEARMKVESRRNTDGAKWYVVRALGIGVHNLELPTWLSQIVLHPQLLAVVDGYLGFFSRLIYADVWHNFPVAPGEPGIDSEHWHRDHEDLHVFKVFLNLCDIDDGNGPYQYMRRTHPLGTHYGLFPHTPPLGTYPPEAAVEATVPQALRTVCRGPAGTMVLVDSVGFHRGGRCTARPRTLIAATYASDLAIDPNTYRLADAAQYEALDAAGRYAIRAR
jgi:hypothetical protein